MIASGIVLLRWKPRRILRTATFGAFGLALPFIALARPEPLVTRDRRRRSRPGT